MTPSAWTPVEEPKAKGWTPVEEDKPAAPGYLSQVGTGLWNTVKGLAQVGSEAGGLAADPLHMVEHLKNLKRLIVDPQVDQAIQAADKWKAGDRSEAVGHALASILPGVGPAAANIGDKAGSGDFTGAAADATTLGATMAAPHLVGPALNAAPVVGTAAKGAVKGAYGAATEMVPFRRFGVSVSLPKPLVTGGATAAAARMMGLPGEIGGAVGAAAPIVKGAYTGARAALSDRIAAAAESLKGPEVATPTAGETFAKNNGVDWARLNPDDKATYEVIARAHANEAAQRAAAPPQRQIAPPEPEETPVKPGRTIQQMVQDDVAARRPAPPVSQPSPPQSAPAPAAAPASAKPSSQSLAEQLRDEMTANGYKPAAEESAQPPSPPHQANIDQKAQRFAQALQGYVSASELKLIPKGRMTPEQLAKGAVPGWDNITEDLIAKGKLKPEDVPPSSSLSKIAQYLEQNTAKSSRAKLSGKANKPAAPAPNDAILTEAKNVTDSPAASDQGTDRTRAAFPVQVPSGSESPGQATEVTVPGSDRAYKAQYKVVELPDLQTSHNGQTFQPNSKYKYANDRDYSRAENQGKVVNGAMPGKFDPRYLLTDNPDSSNGPPVTSEGHALGGNGRGMILQRVYGSNPLGAALYKNMLAKKAAQFGIDPEQLKGMKQPVLTREIDPAEFHQGGQQDAVTDFNKTGTAALRGSEKAIADSRRVSQETLDHIGGRLEAAGQDATLSQVLDGASGGEVLHRLIQDGVISPQESAAYVDRGLLTADGKTRISKLMLGRFFRDPAQLDTTAPALRNKIERIAAPLAKVESSQEWSLTKPLQSAMDLLEEARAHGAKNLDDVISQSGLFGDQTYSPESVALAKAIHGLNPNDLTKAVRQYAQDASEAKQGPGLFGDPPTPAESFKEAFEPKPARKSK